MIEIFTYTCYVLLSAFILWLLFVNAMTLVKYEDKIRESKWAFYPIAVIFGISFLYDVLFNIVIGSVLFLAPPDWKNANTKVDVLGLTIALPTLSERLYDILHGWRAPKVYSFRWRMAKFICRYLIEPWDLNHCGLVGLEDYLNRNGYNK